MKKFVIFFLFLFLLLGGVTLVFQSNWGKEKILAFLQNTVKDAGVTLEIGEISGALPQQVILTDVHIQSPGWEVWIGKVEAHLSFWRLLKREICFLDVKGDRLAWKHTESSHGKPKLPYTLSVKNLIFTHVDYLDTDWQGSFRLGKNFRSIFCDLTVTRPEFPTAKAHLFGALDRDGKGLLKISLATPTLKALPFDAPIDGPLHAELQSQGSWKDALLGRGKLSGTFETWEFSSHFARQNADWSLTHFHAANPLLRMNGEGLLHSNGHFASAKLQVQSDVLHFDLPVPVSGRFFANLNIEGKEGTAVWRIPQLKVGDKLIDNVEGSGTAIYAQDLHGKIDVSGAYAAQTWAGSSHFAWKKGQSLLLSQYDLHSGDSKLKGDLEIRPNHLLIGTTTVEGAQWNLFFPTIYGTGSGQANWFISEEKQGLSLSATATEFYWKELYAQTLSLTANLIDFAGPIDMNLVSGTWRTLALDMAHATTSLGSGPQPFFLTLQGKWDHPLALELDGAWTWQTPDLTLQLARCQGHFFNHPLFLSNPVTFTATPDTLTLSDLSLRLGEASLSAALQKTSSASTGHLTLSRMPLDVLSLNPLEIATRGTLNFDSQFTEKNGHLNGQFKADVQDIQVTPQGDKSPLNASGAFQGNFNRDRLEIDGKIAVQETPLLDIQVSLPIHLELWPWHAEFLLREKAKGHLTLNGRLEQFLDFFDLGTHHLEGNCAANLSFHGNLTRPIVTGQISLTSGAYENYFTGTSLQNIDAKWEAKNDLLILRHFTAKDMLDTGTLTATGQLSLSLASHFPFTFQAGIEKFHCVTFDLVTTQADGEFRLSGDSREATLAGHLEVVESNVAIPNRIPRKYPDLQVVYRNPVKPPALPTPPSKHPYPLHFDLQVNAPDSIFIRGRGLQSEWHGNFHLSGTQTALISHGKIELVKGEFLFSGRALKLTQGTLSFSGKENEIPRLNLTATLDVKDVSIVANLHGPLNNPQVTLRSTPPLPMGSIMSYLLFGQDMSEINSFQAFEIANSISQLAGEGPSVLEQTRKSLGVDRLSLVSTPTKNEAGEPDTTLAVQVGKYVTEGVLVSVTQGSDFSNPNIRIEFEVREGFSFVLESQQPQEQGKFSLKWSKIY